MIFEAAHGYTTNVRLDEALAEDNLVAWRLDDHPLPRSHGGPVRAVVPDLYFWKSAKWLTGIKLVEKDEKGYWETARLQQPRRSVEGGAICLTRPLADCPVGPASPGVAGCARCIATRGTSSSD